MMVGIMFNAGADILSWSLSFFSGQVGRYGTPDHLRAQIGDTVYRIWVEQRGREQVSP